MNKLKEFLRTYSKKWYFWVAVVFVILIIIPADETPEKNIVAESTIETQAESVNEEDINSASLVTNVTSSENTATSESQIEVSSPTSSTYKVVSVVDGDTVKVNINGTTETLRLIGLDTPETVDPRKPVQCFGLEASNKAKEILSGKSVRIETDPTQGEVDKYGRKLAYIYLTDGLFYNKHMIEQGYAHEYTYNTPYKYQADFKKAQRDAQTQQRGLWSPTTCNGDTITATEQQSTPAPQSSGAFYTSSYHTSKYYYPAACDGWKSLSASNLKSYPTLNALLAAYPNRTKSPDCN